MTDADITIAGGGAVAAAAALAAAAAGKRVCRLVGKSEQGGGGRRYALSARSVGFLRRLGAAPALLPVHRFILHAGGAPLHLSGQTAPLCYMAEESALMQALGERLRQAEIPDIAADDIRWRCCGDAAVELAVDERPHRTALLGVADGGRSPLAAQIGIHAAVSDFHQHAITAEVTAPSLPADAAQQWFADRDIVALLPAGEQRFSLVWSTAAPVAEDALADALARRIGLDDITVTAGSRRAFPLKSITRAARVMPRTALLGDAAAVLHPLAGQGLNLGLGDAETFIRCLCRRTDLTLPLGLAAYSRARVRRAAQLQHLTRFLLERRARAAALLTIARLPLLARAAIAFANA